MKINWLTSTATKPAWTSSTSETKASKNTTIFPDVLAQEIVEDREAALEQFREIVKDLEERRRMKRKFSVFIFVVLITKGLFHRPDFR